MMPKILMLRQFLYPEQNLAWLEDGKTIAPVNDSAALTGEIASMAGGLQDCLIFPSPPTEIDNGPPVGT